MANVRSGNSWYVDSTGDLGGTTSYQSVSVFSIALTKTSAGSTAELVLADKTTGVDKIRIVQGASDDTTEMYVFENRPLLFTGGINVGTISTCVATIILEDRGA